MSLLAIDAATGIPLPLNNSYRTQRVGTADGRVVAVSVPLLAGLTATAARLYLMVDTYPAARGTLQLGK